MIDGETLERLLTVLLNRLDSVNQLYISKIAAQIKRIGELNQASINRLVIMAQMNEDMAEINYRLQEATSLNTIDLYKIYQKALEETYTDPRFKRALTLTPLPAQARAELEQYTQSVARQTAESFSNLSNTTAVYEPYRTAVDNAILATSTGLTDYKSATREIVRSIGYNGMQVQYESGYHRRLDTAVRQNVIDGTNQIAQQGSIIMGEALGFDALEISAHARSAPDHEPVQGRVFLKEEFENLQSGKPFKDVDGHTYSSIRRPIGEWNCMHIAMSFSTLHSVRRYTEEELQQWATDNKQGCKVGGKNLTIYQASQLMRQIETAVRRQKDTANAARAAGDTVLREQCQRKINALSAQYTAVATAAGIRQRRDRMTVEGFKPVKIK